ncbi:hypothetical protein MKW94_008048 [Papaver nudicaule]|uniref:Uncharacterized protein n=1 Tax=Papaver nudicaule TaxID=74823 RepID=A0AA41S6N4_PAPNU|nr:hypothetical protein [Papaver nudicaule]
MCFKVEQVSSKLVGPMYNSDKPIKPVPNHIIPLTVFDKLIEDDHAGFLFVYKPPNPPNMLLEQGLRKALVEYPEWAGRFSTNDNGDKHGILLNDKGMRFIEAIADCTLDEVIPFEPATLSSFNPGETGTDELARVQLTRFTCGSLVLFFSGNHIVADGAGASLFAVAWSQACQGLEIHPRPLHNRNIFVPRDPPCVAYDHQNVEVAKRVINHDMMDQLPPYSKDDVVLHKAHFTQEFIAKLKSKANSSLDIAISEHRPYSTFECLIAHIWRTMAKVRRLTHQTTEMKISVNGRRRLEPCVPDEYFGNFILPAVPQCRAKELLDEPLSHTAEVIHKSIAKVNSDYFKSFIDFANNNNMQNEDSIDERCLKAGTLWPYLEVDSWLGFPFNEVDFGCGKPCIFMPLFGDWEGVVYLVPSFDGDGSIDVCITLFKQYLNRFQEICFCID